MEIERTVTLNASPSHVWGLLGTRFHEVGAWASIINASHALSAETGGAGIADRVCDTPDGVFKEQVTNFDADHRTLSYRAYQGLPGFVVQGGNTWTVRELSGGKSEVHMKMRFDLKPVANALMGWMLRRQMGKAADGVLADLKVYAETGEISDRKRAALAKYATTRAPKAA